jgi:hypothetical protein
LQANERAPATSSLVRGSISTRFNLVLAEVDLEQVYLSIKIIGKGGGGTLGFTYGMAVLAYFSYGISVFSLKNCGITILEIVRYTVFAIFDSKTAVIDNICLRYYGIEYPPPPPPPPQWPPIL